VCTASPHTAPRRKSDRTARRLLPAGHKRGKPMGNALPSNLVDDCARMAKRTGKDPPPAVAFLVGLEGSGHHLVEGVVGDIVPKVGGNHGHRAPTRFFRDVGKAAGSSMLSHLAQNPDVHFYGQASYPTTHRGRKDAGARVSLVQLVCLNATGAIDLRLAYLRRNPVDSVCSALRRFVRNETQAVEQTADIGVESFFYIMSILNHEGVSYDVIDFANAITDKATMQRQLESFLRGLATPKGIQTAIEKATVKEKLHLGGKVTASGARRV